MQFTIITPSYNQAEFLEHTICSVLNQSFTNYEYIVVDGNSSDGSDLIIKKYHSQLSKVIIEQDDGQADAINKGFLSASGDIYAYLNSDDYYFRDTLEKVEEFFKKNPDVDMVYGDCVFTDKNGQFLRYFSEISDYNEDLIRNFSDHVMQPAAFWRKEAFEKFGPFDKNLHYGFDWAFWCELARNGCRIKRMPQVLAANRVYSQTKTLSGSSNRLAELKLINKKYKTRLLNHSYFRYCLQDLSKKESHTVLDYFLMPWFFVLSYGTIIHHVGNFKEKVICGFLPKSSYVVRKASIKIPRLKYKNIRICLSVKKNVNQVVTVCLNGKRVDKYLFADNRLEINLPLNEESKDVDVSFVFENEYSQFRNVLSRMLFFYKPKNIAAEISSVVMS